MSEPPRPPGGRRIAVVLDASVEDAPRLAVAALAAAALEAGIEGVFVEDRDLLRTAGLSFLRETRAATLSEHAVDPGRLARELRVGAKRAREAVERSAREVGVLCSFRVWRGDLEAEILNAGLDAPMLALGRIGRFAPLWARRLPRGGARRLRVGVLYRGAQASAAAFAVAVELARGDPSGLIVLIAGTEEAGLRAEVEARLGATARLVGLPQDGEGLTRGIAAAGLDLLVVDPGSPLVAPPLLWRSLAVVGCPWLVVRGG